MSSNGENINHFNAIRLRINGSGVFRMSLIGLDGNKTQTLATLNMSNTPGSEPTKLCNFMSQRAQLRGETIAINEKFRINRICVFVKPVFTSFPQ